MLNKKYRAIIFQLPVYNFKQRNLPIHRIRQHMKLIDYTNSIHHGIIYLMAPQNKLLFGIY